MVFYYYHLPHNSSFPNKWIFLFKKINKIIQFFFFPALGCSTFAARGCVGMMLRMQIVSSHAQRGHIWQCSVGKLFWTACPSWDMTAGEQLLKSTGREKCQLSWKSPEPVQPWFVRALKGGWRFVCPCWIREQSGALSMPGLGALFLGVFPSSLFSGIGLRADSQPGQEDVALLVMAAGPERGWFKKKKNPCCPTLSAYGFLQHLHLLCSLFLEATLSSYSNLVHTAYYFAKE